MELLFFRGLNCRLACIINIANFLGVNYPDAFATLWSETDFTDEADYNIYVSKRVFTNLEAIGVITETADCREIKAEEIMPKIPDGEPFFVGMDIFYIPWHPVYKNFHGPHYFFAQKETADSVLCFDPVYNIKDIKVNLADILPFAFELSRVHMIYADPPQNGVIKEAGAVLRCHPETRERLLSEILKCGSEGRNKIILLIKQVIAMINNRYLFQHFICNSASISGRYEHLFNKAYFSKWEALRNGLYKASIVKDNKNVIDEVYSLFSDLMLKEMAIAEEIIIMGGVSETDAGKKALLS